MFLGSVLKGQYLKDDKSICSRKQRGVPLNKHFPKTIRCVGNGLPLQTLPPIFGIYSVNRFKTPKTILCCKAFLN